MKRSKYGRRIAGTDKDLNLKPFVVYPQVVFNWVQIAKGIAIGFGVALAVMLALAFKVQASTIRTQSVQITNLKKSSMESLSADRAARFMARLAHHQPTHSIRCQEPLEVQ